MGFDVTVELETETCCTCHMTFAMPADFKRAHKRSRKDFFCPAGHAQHYLAESEETKLRRERDLLKQQLAQKDDEIRDATNRRDLAERGEAAALETARSERARANGYKGHAARITKRAQAGVCPCCNRTFAALADHMRTQHPDFTPIDVAQGEPDPVPA